jgi:hypothetical protein
MRTPPRPHGNADANGLDTPATAPAPPTPPPQLPTQPHPQPHYNCTRAAPAPPPRRPGTALPRPKRGWGSTGKASSPAPSPLHGGHPARGRRYHDGLDVDAASDPRAPGRRRSTRQRPRCTGCCGGRRYSAPTHTPARRWQPRGRRHAEDLIMNLMCDTCGKDWPSPDYQGYCKCGKRSPPGRLARAA